ncbi:MAG: hypothetical protein HDR04_03090 [Lachnospiraceae bacterium]|nr:hypothetical protein [Lachnospiraceae bacterium]
MMKKKSIVVAVSIVPTVIMMGLFTSCGVPEDDNLSAGSIEAEEILLDDITEGDLTEADKKMKYTEYLQELLSDSIEEGYPTVKCAAVTLAEAGDNMQAVISLELQEDLSQDSVSEIAEYVATAVGDSSTDNIVIQDTEGTVLFE